MPRSSPALPMEEAARWLARLWADDASPQDLADCADWRAADARNEQAWLEIGRVAQQFDAVGNGRLGHSVLRQAGAPAIPGRRRALQMLGGAGLAVLAGHYGLTHRSELRGLVADYRTGVGGYRQLVLGDGSRVDLNTATALDVHFDDRQRQLCLYQGEIRIRTGHESPRRNFTVETAFGQLTALGTEFTVRLYPDRCRVAVFEGLVAVNAQGGDNGLRLRPGEQLSFGAGGSGRVEPADVDAAAWSDGRLVVERARLADVVAELARYRTGILSCDASVAQRRVSGVFSTRDPDRALRSLAASLGLELIFRSRYWVTLAPARPRGREQN